MSPTSSVAADGGATWETLKEAGRTVAAWAIPLSAGLLFFYPVALLACTAAEGRAAAAAAAARLRAQNDHKTETALIDKDVLFSPQKGTSLSLEMDHGVQTQRHASAAPLAVAAGLGAALAVVAAALPSAPEHLAAPTIATEAPFRAEMEPTAAVGATAGFAYASASAISLVILAVLLLVLGALLLAALPKRALQKAHDRKQSEAATSCASASTGDSCSKSACVGERVVIVMVGLPARGKSHISGCLVRHLHALGIHAKAFNAGALRRQEGNAGAPAEFFSASNAEAKKTRDRLAMESLHDLLHWLSSDVPADASGVAILDATNTTAARRRAVLERCSLGLDDSAQPLRVVFLESKCDDPAILEANYGAKLSNDDYKGAVDAEAALADFRARVVAYEKQYEPLDDDELLGAARGAIASVSAIRVVNGGRRVELLKLPGRSYATTVISDLLQSMHLKPRKILLVSEAKESVPLLCRISAAPEEESFEAMARRLREDLLAVERSQAPTVVVECPQEAVRQLFVAHFCGCAPSRRPEDLSLPSAPVLELHRGNAGGSKGGSGAGGSFALRPLEAYCEYSNAGA
eukprot:TRINITY_DN54845_c0_g1_i1.p1 TRINITY_DN54845_c0_g1~~TRINITY_DN54845_c0_g1_i1.p1  ORF type:complete len:580 (+),score=109.61 TRINITY_DN54845_c0_g1_i1:141-1880(+)